MYLFHRIIDVVFAVLGSRCRFESQVKTLI